MEKTKQIKSVLSIAGSDSSGGAGIQADIKTITAHKLFATTAITAVTAQNTTGVFGIHNLPAEFVADQIDCVFSDIPPDAVKIGMVSECPIIEEIADRLSFYRSKHVVLDPVMVATSGGILLKPEAIDTLTSCLLPLAELITPNIPEAQILADRDIDTVEDMKQAAVSIAARFGYDGAILIKGGHLTDSAEDYLFADGDFISFPGKHIETPNTHGTGCTLSSAIACNLAIGLPLPKAVQLAKEYVTNALAFGLEMGHGNGPLNHMYAL